MAAKPALRNLLLNKTKVDFGVALVISTIAALGYKYGIMEQRRARYTEFHRTYDADAAYDRMKKAGVFDSVNKMIEEGHLEKA